jgi:class 3 adenylate cyclase
MKTDLRGFTTKVGMLSSSDLSALLRDHKQMIIDTTTVHEGLIIKGEGDSFWIVFPSVTSASLAAVEIQDKILASQKGQGEDSRLSVRITITLGDVLHSEKDIFGDAVNLAARLESVTPADEIYLSNGAWLALNKAEVKTQFVNEFNLKGFGLPERVYRVLREHKTRIIEDQVIVVSDVRNFMKFANSASVKDVEAFLLFNENLHTAICTEFGGTVRVIVGDEYFFTFQDDEMAVEGVYELVKRFSREVKANKVYKNLSIAVCVHRGTLKAFRFFLFGDDINITGAMDSIGKQANPQGNTVVISGDVLSKIKNKKYTILSEELSVPKGGLLHEKGIKCFLLQSSEFE